jgi:hypothetical protein
MGLGQSSLVYYSGYVTSIFKYVYHNQAFVHSFLGWASSMNSPIPDGASAPDPGAYSDGLRVYDMKPARRAH